MGRVSWPGVRSGELRLGRTVPEMVYRVCICVAFLRRGPYPSSDLKKLPDLETIGTTALGFPGDGDRALGTPPVLLALTWT